MKKTRIFIIKRGHLITALLLIVAVTAVLSQAASVMTPVSALPKTRDLPIYYVASEDKVCSLTFDAAWGADDTQQIIDALAEHNVRATFFLVGQWVDKYPDMVRLLFEAGHEIMNHSDTHPHMTRLSREKMIEEVRACGDKIEAITGVKPDLFRPPYGDYNDEVVGAMREAGYFTIQWNVDSLDWKDLTAAEITKRVSSRMVPGSIILMHNGAKHTPASLPGLIDKLLEMGYSFVPVSELILKESFIVEHDGRQVPAPKTEPVPEQ